MEKSGKNRKNCRPWIICVLVILLMVFCCSCGKEKEQETVNLSVWTNAQDQELMESMVASFEEEYAKEAEFEITVCEEEEYSCADTVMLCPEAAADIFVFADDQLQELVQAGALLPVSLHREQVISESGGEASSAIAAASYDGELYAYPLTASNGYFLYYNADYFTEEDVKSLDTILSVAAQHGKKFGMELTSGWYLYSFFEAAGLDVHVNEDGVTNTCEWNNRKTSDGKYAGVDVARALLKIATSEGFVNVENDPFVEGIEDGTIIAGISGTWNATVVQKAFGEGYRATKLPTYRVAGKDLQMHSAVGYKLVGVNAHSEEAEWSQRLAEWITNEENQLRRFEERGEGPANVHAAATKEVQKDAAIAALAEQAEYGHQQLVANSYWTAAYQFGNVIVSGNIEHRDLQELLDEMVDSASKEMK